MFVEVDGNGAAVREPDVLTSLSVRVGRGVDDRAVAAALDGLGRLDGSHVWLDVPALRDRAGSLVGRDGRADWEAGFDGMIAYATSKGWVADGAVRAHLEREAS